MAEQAKQNPPLSPPPHIDIIFLGSPGVGKATFLSRLPHVQHPSVTRREKLDTAASAQQASQSERHTPPNSTQPPSNDSQATLVASDTTTLHNTNTNSSQTTLVPIPPTTSPHPPIHTARPPPLINPLNFNVQLFSRPYTITLHPSTSPLFIDPFPLSPNLLILCYSIPDRASLFNIQHYWMPQYHLHYPTSSIPVLLMGLKRDLRTAKIRVVDVDWKTGKKLDKEREEYECVMPEEGVQVAREMRADRYVECSALTGDLLWEATQDITKMAASAVLDQREGKEYATEMCGIM